MADDFALDTVAGLSGAIYEFRAILGSGRDADFPVNPFVAGSIYCGRCRGLRRVQISSSVLFDTKGMFYRGIGQVFKVGAWSSPVPALFRYACIQCDAAWSVLVHPAQ